MDETSAATTTPHRHALRRFAIPPKLPQPVNPALLEHAEEQARDVQNRIADVITRFAGSMTFVYLHVIWFACWIGFGVESYPYGLLTMIVSLEAIFLSTFVMISQNRADAKRQVIADQQWTTVQEEDQQNRQLLDLSEQILELTKAVHEYAQAATGAGGPASVSGGETAISAADGALRRRPRPPLGARAASLLSRDTGTTGPAL
jgi:low affinity Fe/Cu permease